MRRDIKHSHTEITPLRRDKGMKTGLSLVVENNDSPRRTRIPEFYCLSDISLTSLALCADSLSSTRPYRIPDTY